MDHFRWPSPVCGSASNSRLRARGGGGGWVGGGGGGGTCAEEHDRVPAPAASSSRRAPAPRLPARRGYFLSLELVKTGNEETSRRRSATSSSRPSCPTRARAGRLLRFDDRARRSRSSRRRCSVPGGVRGYVGVRAKCDEAAARVSSAARRLLVLLLLRKSMTPCEGRYVGSCTSAVGPSPCSCHPLLEGMLMSP